MTLRRPFDATTLPALIMKIMKGTFDPVPDMYSLELKELLSSMLQLDPHQRPTAAQIMCHPALIKVIFKLYLEIGSIPLSKMSRASNLKVPEREYIGESTLSKRSTDSLKIASQIWLYDNQYQEPLLLSQPLKDTILLVSLGLNHKIGLAKSGQLISWESGLEHTISKSSESSESCFSHSNFVYILDERLTLNIVSVVCGNDFTVCLSDNGVVFSFGKSSSGCLGMSTEKDFEQPKIIETLFGHHIRSIACGPQHVLVLSDENEVFAWGHGNLGCLGLGSTEFELLPKQICIKSDTKIKNIFCGIDCSFLILENYSVMACGSNRHNKLALDIEEGHQIEEVRRFIPIKAESLSRLHIISVGSGKAHSAFLTDKNEVYTVGSNRYSQLGWGNPGIDYSMPQKVDKLKNVKISKIKCGSLFTVAVSKDRYFFCWGKCPDPLVGDNSNLASCDVKIPVHFKNKYVHSVSCGIANCIVIGEDRD